ncbi:MAG: CYTH domain-containing protein [Pseudoflavonifractor sp.]|nr:CYTH domain-containing protein [Alloprevotella sp.]MCM1116754.1 CYTH domain-containing protein [Pseudoflavonifractor sp.]
MAKEIERKFLVNDGWEADTTSPGVEIMQAYLSDDPRATVRIRIAGPRAFITVKGLTHSGISRDEWEYPVPLDDAREMIDRCGKSVLSKTRFHAGRWEIDIFHEALQGLVVAEIELSRPDEEFPLPAWIGREVTGDPRYYNSSLAAAQVVPL